MSAPATPWTELEGGVRVRQSAAYRMNSVVLLHPEHALVVDPGILPAELDDLARVVRDAAPATVTLFLTHAHWDHVLGRPWFPGARTIAHDRFASELRRDAARILGEIEKLAEAHGQRWTRGFEPFKPDLAVSGLHFTRIGPWRVVFRDAKGHSGSQLSLHLPELRLLIAADMLSDLEIPDLDRPPGEYLATLEALEPLASHGAIETLIPGHGAIARGADAVLERLQRDLEYLRVLEREAGAARAAGLTLEQTRERMAAMEYTGKHSSQYPTTSIHLENVRFAYQGAPASAGATRTRSR